MPYMIAPGARLEIGPGGKPYETLGACCAPCAQGKRCAALGAVSKSGARIVLPAILASNAQPTRSSMKGVVIIGLAVAAAGGLVLLSRRKRRR